MDRPTLQKLFVLANEFKEGDLPVGGTRDDAVRSEARRVLGAVKLQTLAATVLVEDAVSESLLRTLKPVPSDIAHLTLNQVKDSLLAPGGPRWAREYGARLSSEMIAAVVKLMGNAELSQIAKRLFNPLPGTGRAEGVAVGAPEHFGARIQPNSPGDDEEEILFSILEGLCYGCGDVIIGLNPASDDVETIVRLERLLQSVVDRLELPTRYCVLSDIVKQTEARRRTRVDVGFQSLAGTSKALLGMVGLDIDGIADLAFGFDGLYFETGQGSEVTNGAADGIDMVTLEARSYGVARVIGQALRKRFPDRPAWMIVNDVAGFIGPEVFSSPDQLRRTCLEDTVMAKLHGLTMGLDVCSTFHMGVAPAQLHRLTQSIVAEAAPAYLMAVAGNADPMLGYMTTSFRQHPRLRELCGRRITTKMRNRLTDLGVMSAASEIRPPAEATVDLYASYRQAGGDTRMRELLCEEGRKRLAAMQQKGFDLGYGHAGAYAAPPEVQTRLDRIYTHARNALYARLADTVIGDVCPRRLRVRSAAENRDDYIAHPGAGERIRSIDSAAVRSLYPSCKPQVQVVISDGLNANAVNENLRAVLPAFRHALADCRLGAIDIVVTDGRVRAGYHIGALIDADVIVHFIGERPGTGLDTLSAYLTYGRDAAGRSRWDPGLDHSFTTAVCGIHAQGRRPERAAVETAHYVKRMLEERRSGIALGKESGAA
ncbi:MAG: Ethanolamine ammonia-lyase heavy chain [Chromatiales bacterium USCg_Taylor]|nr:MAG: Ethanolamine ammonia-lyase heavy chain [Chromatiales bacterium USCg_Taylor]